VEEAFYRTVYEIEKIHWWCVARQRIVEDTIRQIELPARARVLDVGCGTGAILEALSARFEAYGTDTSQLAVDLCRQRGLTNAFCCTLETFPQPGLRFDLVTLLDVVEHIDDDLGILREAHRYLRTGGWAVVTVPAYQFLWGPHDVVNHHKRRYTKKSLRRVLQAAGFEVRMLSYFNTILFPVALVAWGAERLLRLAADPRPSVPAGPVNALLTAVFASERYLLRSLALPYGLSLIALARRASGTSAMPARRGLARSGPPRLG
jgi:2-polyprenyl-3-methyl-5-hydroxy-6-metoxy-1,4-benzoquinol methylase